MLENAGSNPILEKTTNRKGERDMKDYSNIMETMGARYQADSEGSLTPLGKKVVYGGTALVAALGAAAYMATREPEIAQTKPDTTPAKQEEQKAPFTKGSVAERGE
jgi:hypothetical protein